MKKVFLISILVTILMGCSTEEPYFQSSPISTSEANANFVRSIAEAQEIAESALEEFSEQTRGEVRTVKSVDVINPIGVTRSEDSALSYVINYENEQGFAIISADTRMDAIWGVSDKGNLLQEEIESNPGLKMFFQNMTNSYIAVKANVPNPVVPDSSLQIAIPYKLKVERLPMIHPSAQAWHQWHPYNMYYPCPFPDRPNDKAPTGCVPLSCAMIASYWRSPAKYRNIELDWVEFFKGNKIDRLAEFIYTISQPDLLDAHYLNIGPILTGVYKRDLQNNVSRTFQSLGYFPIDKSLKDDETLAEDLDICGPVFIYGDAGYDVSDFFGGGHAWVIDGYKVFTPRYVYINTPTPPDVTLYHCLWGVEGEKGNGYYKWTPDGSLVKSTIGNQTYVDDVNYKAVKLTYLYDFCPKNLEYLRDIAKLPWKS